MRYLFTNSVLLGFFSGLVMYISYSISHQAFSNIGLLCISVFIAFFSPFYSRLSNYFDRLACFKTGFVTSGRLMRFLLQLLFNVFIFYTFILSGVLKPENIIGIGGVIGASLFTTLSSQGIQYIAIALSNRDRGNINLNVLIAISISITFTCLATLGLTLVNTVFIISSCFLGVFFFSIGFLSDLRVILPKKGGVGVFLGTFNPIHTTHLTIIKAAIRKRGLEKVYIHCTAIPKLHRDALLKKQIVFGEREAGMRTYVKTDKADIHINYFPTGNKFYEYETRLLLIQLAIKESGLESKVEVLSFPEEYEKDGFYGVLHKVKQFTKGKTLHGIHGSDLGGMLVRNIYDESGWIYPFPVIRKNNISATAIRNGAKGMTTPQIESIISNLKEKNPTFYVENNSFSFENGILKYDNTPLTIPSSKENSDVTPVDSITIKVVENHDELIKSIIVRAIVYMHEQNCIYTEEFDKNDHTASQIIGLLGEEPILTARVRYFQNFAKLERVAVREGHRRKGYARKLVEFLIQLALSKGYYKLYLHAQRRLVPFYQSYGFCCIGQQFEFSDHDYIEMVLELEQSISEPFKMVGVSPMLLNRPENTPYLAGPLEREYLVNNYL